MAQQLVRYVVGEPWPFPLQGEGLQVMDQVTPAGLDLLLVAAFSAPTAEEVRSLLKDPLKVGILSAGSRVVMIVAATSAVQLDAPYASGLNGRERLRAIDDAAGRAHDWPAGMKRLLTLAIVDLDSTITLGIRTVGLSKDWWTSLASLVGSARICTPAERDREAERVWVRYPTVNDMLPDCAIVEQAGAIA